LHHAIAFLHPNSILEGHDAAIHLMAPVKWGAVTNSLHEVAEGRPMLTIRDVAKRAGVAPITVSRLINRDGYVRVERAMRQPACPDCSG
jgi:hypothetical protein